MKSPLTVTKLISCGLVLSGFNPINTGPESDLLACSSGDSFVFSSLWQFQGQGWWLTRSVSVHALWFEHNLPHLASLDHQDVTGYVFACVAFPTKGRNINEFDGTNHTGIFGTSRCPWKQSCCCCWFSLNWLHWTEPSWTCSTTWAQANSLILVFFPLQLSLL